jgi:hypothetical protein
MSCAVPAEHNVASAEGVMQVHRIATKASISVGTGLHIINCVLGYDKCQQDGCPSN